MTQTIAAATESTISSSLVHDVSHARTLCLHCGAICDQSAVQHDAKAFCCSGCVSVYRLLQQSSLAQQYYKSDTPPGIQPKFRQSGEFAYLDDPAVIEKATRLLHGTVRQVRFSVPQIHCSSCVWLLEHLGALQPGIVASRVNRAVRELTLQFDSTVTSLRAAVELLARLGYEPSLSYASLDTPTPVSHPHRRLTRQIAVAGFAFANIMLFSLPDYLSGGEIGTENLTLTFRIASLFLSIPVMFYSAQDYFVKSWLAIRNRTISIDLPIAIGVGMLFVRSCTDVLSGTGPGYFDSFTGLVFFLLLGRFVQHFTFEKLSFDRDFRSFLPIAVLRRDPESRAVASVALDQLRRGDRVIIRNNEIIPADGIMDAAHGSVDYAFVTGESTPSNLLRGEKLFAGGRVIGESIDILLTTEVPSSVLTSLWTELPVESDPSPSRSIADQVAVPFTLVVLLLATATAWYWSANQPGQLWHTVTSVLIVACPCALVIAGPFALATVSRIWGKRGLFLRNPEVIERLSMIDKVVLDKTGTLTNPDQLQLIPREKISSEIASTIASLARHSTHPVSRALASQNPHAPLLPIEKFREFPGEGIEGVVLGKIVRIGKSSFVLNADGSSYCQQGVQHSHVAVSINYRIVAAFQKRPSFRLGIARSLQKLNASFDATVLTGDSLSLNDANMPAFPAEITTRVNCSPREKRDFVHQLESHGSRTLMIGDGLNDAGALQVASVGIAVTDNSAAFTPASDAIMKGSEVPNLPRYLAEAKRVQRSLYVSYGFAILYNVIGLWFAVTGQLSPLVSAILMPLSSISVAIIAVLMSRYAVRVRREVA